MKSLFKKGLLCVKRDSRKPINVSFYANIILRILFLRKKGQIARQSVPIYVHNPAFYPLRNNSAFYPLRKKGQITQCGFESHRGADFFAFFA